jgi:hypothetical protein
MDLKENRKRWKEILGKQKESGETIAQYCKDNDVNIHQFHYYKRQFRKNHTLPVKSDFVEVITPKIIVDDHISLNLNGIEVKMDHLNLIKLLQTVKQLD